jgi:hypothetical protein
MVDGGGLLNRQVVGVLHVVGDLAFLGEPLSVVNLIHTP